MINCQTGKIDKNVVFKLLPKPSLFVHTLKNNCLAQATEKDVTDW